MMSLDQWNGRKILKSFYFHNKSDQTSWWLAQKLEEEGGLWINSFKLIIHKDESWLAKRQVT